MAERRAFTTAGTPACSFRCSRFRRASSWGVGEIADLPQFARWLASAGLDFVQLLPVNEMEEGQNSPYSALSAMAIDPVFIALARRRGVRRGRRRGGARAGRSRAARGRAPAARPSTFAAVRALKRGAFHARFRRLPRAPRAPGSIARARFRRRSPSASAGGSTTTRCSARCTTSTTACYWRDWEPELRDRDPAALDARAPAARRHHPLLPVPAVARRRPVAPRPARVRPMSGSSATFRSWSAATAPTSGRGSTSSASTPRSACRPTPSPRPDRTGACRSIAGTSIAAGRLRLAPAARPALHRALRRVPRRSPRRLLSHLRARARRPHLLHARRRAVADGAGGAHHRRSSASGAPASSPRTSASSPTSSASRWRG